MNVLALQVFVSLCLVAGAVVLYVHTVRARTLDHSDRLALAPLDDDERPGATTELEPVSQPNPNPASLEAEETL
jgi:hypothetical protein